MNLNRRTFFGWIAASLTSLTGIVRGMGLIEKPTKTESDRRLDLQLQLKSDFSRNTEDFKVNQYCQIVPVKKPVGIWYQQVINWTGGDRFIKLVFRCDRRAYAARVGQLKDDAVVAKIYQQRTRELACKAMSFRAFAVCQKLTDMDQYPLHHSMDMHTDGEDWSSSSVEQSTVKKCINRARQQMCLASGASVNTADYRIVMNPFTAHKIAQSPEILQSIQDGRSVLRAEHGVQLLSVLCEQKVIIEDTVVVTNQRGLITSDSVKFVLPSGVVLMLYRPESPVGMEGCPSVSTVSLHVVKEDEMSVRQGDCKTCVDDNFTVSMTSPVNGFLFLNVC